MDREFQQYCERWSAHTASIRDQGERITYFQEQLPLLLSDQNTIGSILKHMGRGQRWPDLRRSGLFNHEVLLYLDPARRFSVRLYFHSPQAHTDIHDHTSWGVSGTPFGKLSVVSYTQHGKIKDGNVQINQKDRKILLPGQVDVTQPWDGGIHKTGSANGELNVMISVYGPPGRRLYVNRYDEKTGSVERIYPPRILRRNLAKEALQLFE